MSRYSLDYSRFDDLEVSSDEEPPIGVPGYIPLDVDGPITGLSAFDDPNREGYEDFLQRKGKGHKNFSFFQHFFKNCSFLFLRKGESELSYFRPC